MCAHLWLLGLALARRRVHGGIDLLLGMRGGVGFRGLGVGLGLHLVRRAVEVLEQREARVEHLVDGRALLRVDVEERKIGLSRRSGDIEALRAEHEAAASEESSAPPKSTEALKGGIGDSTGPLIDTGETNSD